MTPNQPKVLSARLRLQRFSYRFAEQVLNSRLQMKDEVEGILTEEIPDLSKLSRPGLNKLLDDRFVAKGCMPSASIKATDSTLEMKVANMTFMLERVAFFPTQVD